MRKLHTRPTKRRRVKAAVVLAAAIPGTLISAAPSAVAAYPTTPFELHTDTSQMKGTLAWYQRTIGVDYTLKTSSCVRVFMTGYTADGATEGPNATSTSCHVAISGNAAIGVPGTPASIRICLSDVTLTVCGEFKRP
ncbi:hypothetical protein [Amycolatopsis sp. NPDC051128]|uniref:hypothetical protein n=1 Tax=Amycolatopsis sp. NPDC051128 TaxID=3155412 RepID=UPI003430B62A